VDHIHYCIPVRTCAYPPFRESMASEAHPPKEAKGDSGTKADGPLKTMPSSIAVSESETARETLKLKRLIVRQKRARATIEFNLERANRKTAEDGNTIAELQTELSELMESHVRTRRRLDAQVQSNMNLVRERDELRKAITRKDEECSAADERCKLFHDGIRSMEKHRQKEREMAAEEIKRLEDLVSLQKEELKDAETETSRYKKLLDTFASEKLVMDAVSVGSGNTRGVMMEDWERLNKERRAQINFEMEARNVEIARQRILELEEEGAKKEEENRTLRGRICDLEGK